MEGRRKPCDVDDPSQQLPKPVRKQRPKLDMSLWRLPRKIEYYQPWERVPEYRVKLTKKQDATVRKWEDPGVENRYSATDGIAEREAQKTKCLLYDGVEIVRIDMWVEEHCNDMERLVWFWMKHAYETSEEVNVADMARALAGANWKKFQDRYAKAKERLLVKLQQFLRKTA